MLRRSRISVRPNVRPAGRVSAPGSSQEASQEAPAPDPQGTGDLAKAGSQEGKQPSTSERTENPSERPTHGDDGKEASDEAPSSSPSCSAGPQRRKRYSVMPNLAKPRVTSTPTRSTNRTSRSPVKAVSETRVPASALDSEVPGPSAQTVRSPPRRRPSGGSRPSTHARATSVSSPEPSREDQLEEEQPQQGSPCEHPAERQPSSPHRGDPQSDGPSTSQTKDIPPPVLEKATPSLPSREASELSERAKTLVSRSVKCGLSLAPGKSRLSRLLNDPTDLQRLAKARKLRELLRQEMNKDRKSKKAKVCVKEYSVDPSKMTMGDLIYYLPDSNPMTSFVEDKRMESEIVIPNSPSREESPERAQEPDDLPEPARQTEEEREDDEGDSDAGREDQLMVPRVKVAEDGSLIIDEESLTVEVLRAKGPNPVEDRDPIFERGSTTTYSSFRKISYSKPWSSQETDMFYLAISMVGTDFSMIGQLFPHRARVEIKNKFKREERECGWRIDKAFKEKRKLDMEFFSSLLEKILAIGKKKKVKSATEKTVKKTGKTKSKAKKLSDVEEDEEDEEGAEQEGEKENEGVLNEDDASGAALKKKRKKSEEDATSSPEKSRKKKKSKSIIDDEASVPEDSEAALPDDQSPLESSQKADEPVPAPRGPVIKPAQLSRGRTPRPIPNLGRRWGQKTLAPRTAPREATSEAEDENKGDSTSQEQEVASDSEAQGQRLDPSQDSKQTEDVRSSDDEEETTVAPAKPTRYGRMPKLTQHLNYPAKEEATTSAASEGASPSSKAKPIARRGKLRPGPSLPPNKNKSSSKKPKLVTLRASQSEESEEEGDEALVEGLPEEDHLPTSPAMESQAPVFVPYSLRSPQPVAIELEETMEELDISINMPDVLGISDGAVYPQVSCEQGEGGAGGEAPCEHQLDLLVDVIDFLSPDHMEESYNEAARTLLTISNQAPLSQDAQDGSTETNVLIEEEPQHQTPADQPLSDPGPSDIVTPDPAVSVAPWLSPDLFTTTEDPVSRCIPVRQDTDAPPTQGASTNESKAKPDLSSQAESGSDSSEPAASQTRRTRFPKPKPNLGRTARTTQSKPQSAEETVAHLKPAETTSTLTAPSEERPDGDAAILSPQTTTATSHSEPPQATQLTQHPNHLLSCAPPSPESTSLAVPEEVEPSEENMPPQSAVTETLKVTENLETITRPDSIPQTPESNDAPPAEFQPTEVVSTNQGTGCEIVPAPPEQTGSDSSEQTASPAKRSRFAKPKPNLGKATRTTQAKPQLAEEKTVQQKAVESSSTVAASSEAHPGERNSECLPTKETSITADEPLLTEDRPSTFPTSDTCTQSTLPNKEQEGQIGSFHLVKSDSQPVIQEKARDVGSVSRTDSGSDTSKPTVPQPRRSRFPKLKPNLGRVSRPAQAKAHPAEETSTTTSISLPAEDMTVPSELRPGSDTPSNTISSPGFSCCVRSCEDQLGDLQPGADHQQTGPPETSAPGLLQPRSPTGEVEGRQQEPPLSCMEPERSNLEVQGPPAIVQASDPPKESRCSVRLPRIKPNLDLTGQAILSQSSQSAVPSKPGPSIKKPTLGELAAQILDISKPRSRRKVKRPLDGATHPETTPQTATQVPAEDSSTSPIATASTVDIIQTPWVEETQNSPVIRTNSEAPPPSAVPVDQALSDPEEPFFILSLTEIPVLLTGEELAPAPLPFFQAPDPACPQAHSASAVPDVDVSFAIDGVLKNAPEATAELEGGELGMVRSQEAVSGPTAWTDVSEKPAENQEVDPPRKKRKLPGKQAKPAPSNQTLEPPLSEPDVAPVPSPVYPDPLAPTTASPATLATVTSWETGTAETQEGAERLTESPGRQGEVENSSLSSESQDVRGITPLAANDALSRPGRRPRGFLSFMADKSSPTGGPQGTKAASRKPQLSTSRRGRKASIPALTSSTKALPSSPQAFPSCPQALPSSPQVLPSSPQALPSSPQALPSSTQALPSSPQALPSSPQALPSSPQALPSSPQALPSSTQALPSSPQALPSSPQALPSSPQALPSSPQALPSSPQALPAAPKAEASGTPEVSSACTNPESAVSSQSGPSTFQCSSTTEVGGSQQQEEASSAEDEVMNVSQFFFSDIFTEVENEG